MFTRLLVAALLLSAPPLFAPTDAHAGDWEVDYTKDGVTVSKKKVEGTKLVGFKGDTIYEQPIGRVMYVLMDNDHRVEWVDRLYENRIIEQSGPFDYVLYQAFDLPPMFANRDYVYRGQASRDASSGVVTLALASVEHPDAPETAGVRAELVNSRYVLTPISDNQTRVEVEILTDPKGWMPAWLVNLIQKSWPVKTLNGIRGQFEKPYTGTHPLPGEEAGGAAPAPAPAPAPEPEPPAEDEASTDEAADGEATEDEAADDAATDEAASEDAE